MALNTQTIAQFVSNMVTAIQEAAASLIDVSVGSVLLAIVEANAAVAMWMQGLISYLLKYSRASSAQGADLDSWLADFGFTRLSGTAASGEVTFARFTDSTTVTINPGVVVQTADGTLQYQVIADATNSYWNATDGYYIIPSGTASAPITVQALAVGTAYNVSAGQINTLGTAVPGIDTVSNASAFVNGANAESDQAVRARFVLWWASRSQGTLAAVEYAVETTLGAAGTFSITEDQTYSGNPYTDYFYVVVDDGSGNPSSTVLNAVTTAVDAVRPISCSFNVYATSMLTANVSMTIAWNAGYSLAVNGPTVVAYITNQINAGGVGVSLPYSSLINMAYSAIPGAVANVTGVTLNGGSSDLTATNQQSIRAGTVVV